MHEMMPQQPQYERQDILQSRLTIEDIFAVQALAMGCIRMRARTRISDYPNKRYGFSMYDKATDSLDDGSEDQYLTCLVKKVSYDQWRMRVSFLSMYMNEETKRMSVRDDYLFDWLKNGNNMAWASTTLREATDEGLRSTQFNIRPLNSDEVGELRVRMSETSERVNPLQPGSIYSPLTRP